MAGPKLDGAGAVKMETLSSAHGLLARCHSIVEQIGVEVKGSRPITGYVQTLKRAAVPLASLLKGQYGMIADVVTAMLLAATRGGPDQMKLRSLREGIASVRMQLDIAEAKVLEKHAVADEKGDRSE
jgi:hypothetical protein